MSADSNTNNQASCSVPKPQLTEQDTKDDTTLSENSTHEKLETPSKRRGRPKKPSKTLDTKTPGTSTVENTTTTNKPEILPRLNESDDLQRKPQSIDKTIITIKDDIDSPSLNSEIKHIQNEITQNKLVQEYERIAAEALNIFKKADAKFTEIYNLIPKTQNIEEHCLKLESMLQQMLQNQQIILANQQLLSSQVQLFLSTKTYNNVINASNSTNFNIHAQNASSSTDTCADLGSLSTSGNLRPLRPIISPFLNTSSNSNSTTIQLTRKRKNDKWVSYDPTPKKK